jgi:hypothetical protein
MPLQLSWRAPEFDLINAFSRMDARCAGMPSEMRRNTPPGTSNLQGSMGMSMFRRAVVRPGFSYQSCGHP